MNIQFQAAPIRFGQLDQGTRDTIQTAVQQQAPEVLPPRSQRTVDIATAILADWTNKVGAFTVQSAIDLVTASRKGVLGFMGFPGPKAKRSIDETLAEIEGARQAALLTQLGELHHNLVGLIQDRVSNLATLGTIAEIIAENPHYPKTEVQGAEVSDALLTKLEELTEGKSANEQPVFIIPDAKPL